MAATILISAGHRSSPRHITWPLPKLGLRYPRLYVRFFEVCGRFVGVKVGVGNFFVGLSIGIDEDNTFQLKFVFKHQNCRSHSFGR